MRQFVPVACMAGLLAVALAGCEGWNVGKPAPGPAMALPDTAQVRRNLPFDIDSEGLARLVGHRADGMRYVLKVGDGDDTLEWRGTVGVDRATGGRAVE